MGYYYLFFQMIQLYIDFTFKVYYDVWYLLIMIKFKRMNPPAIYDNTKL